VRRLGTFAIGLLVLLAAASPSRGADDAPLRIAVFPMASAVADVEGDWLANAVTDALVKVGRYDVLSRKLLSAVLAEQELNNSDLVDPKTAVKVGRLVGARYIATGSLLSANFEPGFFSKDEFRARAQLQLVEVETGRVVVSDTFLGVRSRLVMRRGETLGKLSAAEREKSFNEVATSIALQFADRVNLLHPLEGYVVKVDGARVAINLGAPSGVKVGQEFLVYEDADPIRDPVTGEVLSTDRRSLARLVVTSVEPKLAWTRVLVTYSSEAKTKVAGETVDLYPPKGFLKPEMSIIQTTLRAAEIQPELDRARRRRGH
jgi:TolB-like protein